MIKGAAVYRVAGGGLVRRREFLTTAGAAAVVWPHVARAQSPGADRRRVGLLVIGAAPPTRDLEIVKELSRLGYVEGRNVEYVIASDAGGADQVAKTVRGLIAAKPAVLVGPFSFLAQALADEARDIPLVLTAVADPIETGLSTSMSRPTGHVTGFTLASTSITTKRLQLLRQLLPEVRKVGYLWVPVRPLSRELSRQAKTAAGQLGLEFVSLPVNSAPEIGGAFSTADQQRVGAIMTEADPLTVQFGAAIADECLIRNLPLIDAWPSLVRNGAVIAYGPPEIEHFRGAAGYVDRILKGAAIADLPFVEPTQVKLAINLQTARSVGLTVPANLLALADEVIE